MRVITRKPHDVWECLCPSSKLYVSKFNIELFKPNLLMFDYLLSDLSDICMESTEWKTSGKASINLPHLKAKTLECCFYCFVCKVTFHFKGL